MPTRRPRIGLTTYHVTASFGVWTIPTALLPVSYLERVEEAGGTPLLLPPYGTDPQVLEALDGLVLVGGSDIDPGFYGAEPHPLTESNPVLDAHDLALARAAVRTGVPLLGVCRGAQLLNVALGGTLHQHLPDVMPGSDYRSRPGSFEQEVEFRTEPGSRARTILGEVATAPVHHHQAIDRVADGLRVTARAADGTVEVVESTGPGWALAVQFHPEERRQDVRLFQAFLAQVRRHAGLGEPEEADPAATLGGAPRQPAADVTGRQL